MEIRISMTIDGTETIELLRLERGELQAGNLGFSLAETKEGSESHLMISVVV